MLLFCQLPPQRKALLVPLQRGTAIFAYTNPLLTLFDPPNICKILPRRRGSGSDAVNDEGVETSGKAESRKKKVEIAKRKIACCCFVNSLRISHPTNARPSSKRDSYFCLYKIQTKRIALPSTRNEGQLYCFAHPQNIYNYNKKRVLVCN